MELDATTFFHLQRPYKYGGNPYPTKLDNGDGKQPRETSSNIPLGAGEEEVKQSNEDIHSHIWIAIMSQNYYGSWIQSTGTQTHALVKAP